MLGVHHTVKALACRVLARTAFGRLEEVLLFRSGGITDAPVTIASAREAFVILMAFFAFLLEALFLRLAYVVDTLAVTAIVRGTFVVRRAFLTPKGSISAWRSHCRPQSPAAKGQLIITFQLTN